MAFWRALDALVVPLLNGWNMRASRSTGRPQGSRFQAKMLPISVWQSQAYATSRSGRKTLVVTPVRGGYGLCRDEQSAAPVDDRLNVVNHRALSMGETL